MPTIEFEGEEYEFEEGETVREVLARNLAMPHKGATKRINCGGNSLCGTCALRVVEGPVGEAEGKEKMRLKAATHDDIEDVRLTCQYQPSGDVVLEQP